MDLALTLVYTVIFSLLAGFSKMDEGTQTALTGHMTQAVDYRPAVITVH